MDAKLKNLFVKIIVLILCIGFAFWGVYGYIFGPLPEDGSTNPNSIVATVNGQNITILDYKLAYDNFKKNNDANQNVNLDDHSQDVLQKQVLLHLVMEKALSESAYNLDFRITPGEIKSAILMIPAFQSDGRFSEQQFERIIENTFYTQERFLNTLKAQMLINQLNAGIVNTAFCLPSELQKAIDLINERRDFGYVIVPVNKLYKNEKITSEQVKSFYDTNKNLFIEPERVKLEYIEISLSKMASQQKFSHEQLYNFYQANLSKFIEPKAWKIAKIYIANKSNNENFIRTKLNLILSKLKAGDNFYKLASEYSDDQLTANRGGVVNDWVAAGVDPNIDAALSLLKIDQISEPIKVDSGYIIIKLLAERSQKIPSFNSVKDKISKLLADQQANKIFSSSIETLTNLTYTNPNSLKEAAQALHTSIKNTDYIDYNGTIRTPVNDYGFFSTPKFLKLIFSKDALAGNNSDVIEVNPDTVLVFRVAKHELNTVKNFNDVSQQILDELKMKKAKEDALDIGNKILEEIKNSKLSDYTVAKKYGLLWKQIYGAQRFGRQTEPAIINKIFSVPNITNFTDIMTLPNNDVVIMQLNKVYVSRDKNKSFESNKIYREEIEDSMGNFDYQLYVKNVMDKSKIKFQNGYNIYG